MLTLLDNPYGVPPPGMPQRMREEDASGSDSDSSTPSSVARIPMPPGSPPSRKTVDEAMTTSLQESPVDKAQSIRTSSRESPPDKEALPEIYADDESVLPEAKTTYAAEPTMRNLQQEAANFVPSKLKRKAPSNAPKRAQIDPLDGLDQADYGTEQHLSTAVSKEPTRDTVKVKKRLNLAPNV